MIRDKIFINSFYKLMTDRAALWFEQSGGHFSCFFYTEVLSSCQTGLFDLPTFDLHQRFFLRIPSPAPWKGTFRFLMSTSIQFVLAVLKSLDVTIIGAS